MRLIETDTNTNKDINAAVSVGAYTATATRGVIVRMLADQVAGGGDYVAYVTLQLAGAGSHYRIIPITTATAAAALTAIGFVSLPIPVNVGDVLTVYIDGLSGDTTTPDVRVDFYEQDYLRPTVTGRTLDVAATGEAGLDFANINAASSPTTLTNITVPTVTTVTNAGADTAGTTELLTRLPDAAPGAVGGLPVLDVNLLSGADVIRLDGATDPVDNLVLSLGAGGLVEKLNSMLEAAGLAYRFTAEALAETPTESGSGTGSYTDTISDGATPLDGVRVQLSTDALGSNRVYEAHTNALGVFTMNPDPGTYYRWLDLAGYDFAQGVAVVVT